MSQGDDDRVSCVRRRKVAHDAAFVAGVGQIGDDVLSLQCGGNLLGPQMSGEQRRQHDFERHRRL